MFIEHQQLKSLFVSASKVKRLHISAGPVQLAFPGQIPQLCSAYLLRLSEKDKVLVVIAFYLTESHTSVFYVPEQGEVTEAAAKKLFGEGVRFIESMGFLLSDTDYHLFSPKEQQDYWYRLPISQPPDIFGRRNSVVKSKADIKRLRGDCLDTLGRYLATM